MPSPGALLAGTFATLLYHGHAGYLQSCHDLMTCTRSLLDSLRTEFESELYVLGEPLGCVFAFGSRSEGEKEGGVGIYQVGDELSGLGWHCTFFLSCSFFILLPIPNSLPPSSPLSLPLALLPSPPLLRLSFRLIHLSFPSRPRTIAHQTSAVNALQSPPALHLAVTHLTIPVYQDLLRDLRIAIDRVRLATSDSIGTAHVERQGEGEAGGEEKIGQKGGGKKKEGSMVMIYGLGSSSAVGPGLVEEMSRRYMDCVSSSFSSFFIV